MNANIDISEIVLRTERLILRPWRQEDLDDFYEYASVDGVGQMAGWMPHETKETTRAILDNFINNKKTFALELDGKVIGSLGIELYKEDEFPELVHLRGRSIGYVLSKDYWGQGLMPEAVQTVIRYLFETENWDFLVISHFLRNNRSRRVIEKCGFTYLRPGVHETRYGTKEDVLEYILWKKDWKA